MEKASMQLTVQQEITSRQKVLKNPATLHAKHGPFKRCAAPKRHILINDE
jgi:hypothetical protein